MLVHPSSGIGSSGIEPTSSRGPPSPVVPPSPVEFPSPLLELLELSAPVSDMLAALSPDVTVNAVAEPVSGSSGSEQPIANVEKPKTNDNF